MGAADIIRGEAWEDGGATVLARVKGNSGANITQASVTSITRKVFDLDGDAPDTATSTATPDVASTVFDTLQTDAIWGADATGYNFKDAVPATALATGGHTYRAEYKLDMVSGEDCWVIVEIHAQNVRSS